VDTYICNWLLIGVSDGAAYGQIKVEADDALTAGELAHSTIWCKSGGSLPEESIKIRYIELVREPSFHYVPDGEAGP
jgi:hypothetical protein